MRDDGFKISFGNVGYRDYIYCRIEKNNDTFSFSEVKDEVCSLISYLEDGKKFPNPIGNRCVISCVEDSIEIHRKSYSRIDPWIFHNDRLIKVEICFMLVNIFC